MACAIADHFCVQVRDRLAARFLERERQYGVNEACEARFEQRPAEAARRHKMLRIRLADRRGMLGECAVDVADKRAVLHDLRRVCLCMNHRSQRVEAFCRIYLRTIVVKK